jgi:predicted RNA-binding Zn ribbon-like protein
MVSPSTVQDFRFPARLPALDLTATVRGRLKGEPSDLLQTPSDLDRWIAASGVVDEAAPATEADLAAARTLREAIYAAALARTQGAGVPDGERRFLNERASAPPAVVRLDAQGRVRRSGSPAALLATVARQAIELLDAGAAPVKQCEAAGCAHLFVDTSRSGDRRWCSMTTCGNRAKVAEYRSRRRQG